MTLSQAHRDMKTRRGVRANNAVLSGGGGVPQGFGFRWRLGVWAGVLEGGMMGRAEVRGNQQHAVVGDRRQDRTQAALGGRVLGGVSGMGVLSLVLNQTAAREWSKQVESAVLPLRVRRSAQHQEGPSRSCSATCSARLRLASATQDPRFHGAARQLTDHGTASLAYSNNIPALFLLVRLCYGTFNPPTGAVPPIASDRERESAQPSHRFFSERVQYSRYIHHYSYTPADLCPW